MNIPPKLRDPARRIDNPCYCWQGLSDEPSVHAGDVVDSSVAAVAQGVDEEPVSGLVCCEQSGHGSFDVGATFAFRVEEKLDRVDCYEDDSGVGEKCHIGFGVVGDVFGDCIHPGAEEDGCWCRGKGLCRSPIASWRVEQGGMGESFEL